ncbi:beta-glucosidase [Acidobacteriota bacterium]
MGSFGTGRAVIDAGDGDGIVLYNTAGMEIRDLVITGDWDADAQGGNTGNGVLVYLDLDGVTRLDHVYLDNLEVRGFQNAGVVIGAWPGDGSMSGFTDVRITGVQSHNNGDAGISAYGYWDPSSADYAHRDMVVRGCKTYSNRGIINKGSHSGNGIVLSGVDGALIEYCESYDNGDLCDHNGGGPIGIWAWDAVRVTIQFNESHHNRTGAGSLDGGGYDLDGGVTESLVQYNYSHDNDGAGYLMWQFNGARPLLGYNTFRYNISENDGRAHGYGGIYVGGGNAVENNHFYNNTLYVSPSGNSGTAAITVRGVGDGNTFRNNILVTEGGVPLVNSDTDHPAARAVFQGNAYYAGTVPADFEIRWGGIPYADLASWRATGQETNGVDDTGLQEDPGLTAPGAGGTIGDPYNLGSLSAYTLLSSSSLIHAGLDLQALFAIDAGRWDFFGTVLPQGAAYDVGAHEWADCTPPGAVGNTLKAVRSGGDISFYWDDLPDATGYTLYQATVPGGPFVVPAGIGNSGPLGITLPMPGDAVLFYRICGTNDCGEGPI